MVAIVAAVVLSGTVFYALEEGWSLINALYFSIITLTTIGYGDLSPTTDVSKVFTMLFVVCGVAMFGIFIRDIANRAVNTLSAPILGASILENSRRLTNQLDLPSTRGVVALSVSSSGALGRSGIKDRDVIVFINNKPVHRVSQVFDITTKALLNNPVEFTIIRQDGIHKVSVNLVPG
ncbi:ion channel [Marinimicrobium agarilyticum]|uniref:ion channel n=1 Tax=Marinimicrobium agarilyticum TaxID=306546 RepID=UPI0003FFCB50|nr:ion channel [Marinimicrobium agarilyticum]